MGIRMISNMLVGLLLLTVLMYASIQTVDSISMNQTLTDLNNVKVFFTNSDGLLKPDGIVAGNGILFDTKLNKFLHEDGTRLNTLKVLDAVIVTKDVYFDSAGKVTVIPCNRLTVTFETKRLYLGRIKQFTLSKNLKVVK